jgi:hypothetical protein
MSSPDHIRASLTLINAAVCHSERRSLARGICIFVIPCNCRFLATLSMTIGLIMSQYRRDSQ